MIRAAGQEAVGPLEIVIVRTFAAPRELVFRNWVEAELVQAWFAPVGFTATSSEVDARPGGSWRVEYRSDRGRVITEHGEFREVAAPERLVFTLVQEDGDRTGPETVVTVSFTEAGAQTEMRFHQTGFESAARRDGNTEGWGGCFAKLEVHLASQ